MAKLRYCTTIEPTFGVNPTAGSTFMFLANGCFDPEVAVGGHQPIGFDQYMTLYNHWYVAGSKITLTFLSLNSGTNTGQVVVGTRLSADTVAMTDKELIRELPKTKWAYLTNTGGSHGIATIRRKFSHKRFFGGPLKDDQYKGSIIADPDEKAYYHVRGHQAYTSAATTAVVSVLVTIEYIVKFGERKTLIKS